MSHFGSWRPSLRMARRDAVRHRGRSILVLVMIALPVLGVTAADVVIQTQEISGSEALERRLGTADALVTFAAGDTQVYQGADPVNGNYGSDCCREEGSPEPNVDTVSTALGRDVHAVPYRSANIEVTTDKGVRSVEAIETDLTDPLTRGLFDLTQGALPGAAGEIAINSYLADRGFDVGDALEVQDGSTLSVVGIVESTSSWGYPIAVAAPGSLGIEDQSNDTWLVEAGDVPWRDVLALNAVGASVLSRAVLLDPPDNSEVPPEIRQSSPVDDGTLAVAALVVVMALIEVVLLAGPAFAVGARRQSRTLALMAASGGTPRQARRVVLANGVVLGSVGAGLGVLLGIGGAAVALPILQRYSDQAFGPFDVPWPHLAGIAAFGLLSALLAAVVPAWIASRQDVVAVLAGRRGDRRPSLRSPLLGLLLLGGGVAGATYGALKGPGGEIPIAASAILAVLGMVLLIPVVVAGLARVCRRLPLVLRYAVRDAARHRTRTVPAVAAVAATVAGVVALGIGVSSDELENQETYSQMLPMGDGAVAAWSTDQIDWEEAAEAVAGTLPDATVSEIRGLEEQTTEDEYVETVLSVLDGPSRLLDGYGSILGSSVLVSDGPMPATIMGLDAAETDRAEAVLARGGAVVFTSLPVDEAEVRIVRERWSEDPEPERLAAVTVPAAYVEVGARFATAQAVVAPEVLTGLEEKPAIVGLHVTGDEISSGQQADVEEALGAIDQNFNFSVERGYQSDDEARIMLLVLAALGGVLMLGGTLTATFLALSDARPDLATLAAVGAAPRARRGVASAYAIVVGLVGATLGAAVGFIPGIAVTYPLTGQGWYGDGSGPSHYLDIPWLMIASVVVLLPLLTALIVGLSARSRLPLVARVD